MAITNGYATLAEFKALPDITSPDNVDDDFIEDVIERASRAIDDYCGRWFYAYTDTREFDFPRGRKLTLTDDLLTVTTLTNGDGAAIAATEYNLLPQNWPTKYAIELKQASTVLWQADGSGNTRGVIGVTGTWGYVNRASSDPESMQAILNTNEACLIIAMAAYKKRYGVGVEGVAQVTGAGVVITPRGIPADAKRLLDPYKRIF